MTTPGCATSPITRIGDDSSEDLRRGVGLRVEAFGGGRGGGWSLGFEVWGRGCCFGFRVSGFGFRVLDFGFWMLGLGFEVLGFGFWIWGLGVSLRVLV